MADFYDSQPSHRLAAPRSMSTRSASRSRPVRLAYGSAACHREGSSLLKSQECCSSKVVCSFRAPRNCGDEPWLQRLLSEDSERKNNKVIGSDRTRRSRPAPVMPASRNGSCVRAIFTSRARSCTLVITAAPSRTPSMVRPTATLVVCSCCWTRRNELLAAHPLIVKTKQGADGQGSRWRIGILHIRLRPKLASQRT